jgi:hypothetical protein
VFWTRLTPVASVKIKAKTLFANGVNTPFDAAKMKRRACLKRVLKSSSRCPIEGGNVEILQRLICSSQGGAQAPRLLSSAPEAGALPIEQY